MSDAHFPILDPPRDPDRAKTQIGHTLAGWHPLQRSAPLFRRGWGALLLGCGAAGRRGRSRRPALGLPLGKRAAAGICLVCERRRPLRILRGVHHVAGSVVRLSGYSSGITACWCVWTAAACCAGVRAVSRSGWSMTWGAAAPGHGCGRQSARWGSWGFVQCGGCCAGGADRVMHGEAGDLGPLVLGSGPWRPTVGAGDPPAGAGQSRRCR